MAQRALTYSAASDENCTIGDSGNCGIVFPLFQ